jgi:hypothetical protein
MRRILPGVAFLLVTAAASPLWATPITGDPVIGVRGREDGSDPSSSRAFFEMGGCPGDLADFFGSDIFCQDFDIVQSVTEITSLTLRFRDDDGLIPSELLFRDTSFFDGFDSFERLEDGFSVRFFFSEGGSLLCPVLEGDDVPCAKGSVIQIYLHVPDGETPRPPYSVSLRAINDEAIPEPGLLALMGLGFMIAGRRLRRRLISR